MSADGRALMGAQKPRPMARNMGPSSTMMTSICWLPFCACSLASVSVELPATYSILTLCFFSNAGKISFLIVCSNEPP